MWRLAFYTSGYQILEDGSSVGCIYIPTIKAQVQVPEEELDGTGIHTWNSRPLLHCTLSDASYVDGLNDSGISLHTPEPQPTLSECMKEVDQLEAEGKDSHRTEPFIASPSRKASLTKDYDASYHVWKQNKDFVTNNEDNPVSRLGSPVKTAAKGPDGSGQFWCNQVTLGAVESSAPTDKCEICRRFVVQYG